MRELEPNAGINQEWMEGKVVDKEEIIPQPLKVKEGKVGPRRDDL